MGEDIKVHTDGEHCSIKVNVNVTAIIEKYFNILFKDVIELIAFHKKEIIDNKQEIETEINYLKLYPFTENTIMSFSRLDIKIKTELLQKLTEDIAGMRTVYINYIKRYKSKDSFYLEKFIEYVKKRNLPIKEYLENEKFSLMVSSKFDTMFEKLYFDQKYDLEYIINNKGFYLDKLLWSEVNKSERIKEQYRELAEYKKLNLKIYLKFYLSKVNVFSSKDPGWKDFLEDTIGKI
jgi:hypothetical protein